MSKRKYRPGIPFDDPMELVRWLIVLRLPVYLKRDLNQKWKRQGDLKFLNFGFAGSMHLLDLVRLVQKRLLLSAYQPADDQLMVKRVPHYPENRPLSDICPLCHRLMRLKPEKKTGRLEYHCQNEKCQKVKKQPPDLTAGEFNRSE